MDRGADDPEGYFRAGRAVLQSLKVHLVMTEHYVYILASHSRILYTGVTSNLARRLSEHRSGRGSKFCSRFKITRLVYFESCSQRKGAEIREKQIKRWGRAKKIALIESLNPDWEDLSQK